MVFEEIVTAFPQLEKSINALLLIVKIVGGIIGAYFLISIINFFINLRRGKQLKQLIERLDENNNKLDSLLKAIKK